MIASTLADHLELNFMASRSSISPHATRFGWDGSADPGSTLNISEVLMLNVLSSIRITFLSSAA